MDEEEIEDEKLALDDEMADDEEEEDPLSMGFHEVDAFEPEQDF